MITLLWYTGACSCFLCNFYHLGMGRDLYINPTAMLCRYRCLGFIISWPFGYPYPEGCDVTRCWPYSCFQINTTPVLCLCSLGQPWEYMYTSPGMLWMDQFSVCMTYYTLYHNTFCIEVFWGFPMTCLDFYVLGPLALVV